VHDELEPLIELSTLYLIRGEFTAAMQASVDAFNRDRQSARALFNLGAALYCSSMFDLARGALLRAISIDARATQARLLVIRMLLQQRNWDEALQHVELYLKENRRGAEREAVLKVRTELQRRNRVPPSELTLDFPVRLGPVVRTNVCGN
jgi:tetratricopeptide (TPR) repeat protein